MYIMELYFLNADIWQLKRWHLAFMKWTPGFILFAENLHKTCLA